MTPADVSPSPTQKKISRSVKLKLNYCQGPDEAGSCVRFHYPSCLPLLRPRYYIKILFERIGSRIMMDVDTFEQQVHTSTSL